MLLRKQSFYWKHPKQSSSTGLFLLQIKAKPFKSQIVHGTCAYPNFLFSGREYWTFWTGHYCTVTVGAHLLAKADILFTDLVRMEEWM